MAPFETPSRPARAPASGTDPPDRDGASMLTDLLSAHPLARGFSATPMRPSTTRARDVAFTPSPAQPSKHSRAAEAVQSAAAVASNAAAAAQAAGVTAPQVATQEDARPSRSAAVQAAYLLTKEAQAAALGLSGNRRAPGTLGATLGIASKSATPQSASSTPSPEDKETDSVMAGDSDDEAAAPPAGADADRDMAAIKAVQQRQAQRTTDTSELCRVIDKTCASGAVSASGAELLRASLALALRHTGLDL
ncbi:hypothetical protein OC844_001805 [Tilletia horrida]|nr:hypothetical protein OC844_001805 [Tilletia horrida]